MEATTGKVPRESYGHRVCMITYCELGSTIPNSMVLESNNIAHCSFFRPRGALKNAGLETL